MGHFDDMEPILNDHDLKFVFVGGKGGVGKTTSSSALAIQLSYDRKVLLISTDPAHSLSDAFRCQFSNEPTTVPEAPNLDVMEVNPEAGLQDEIAKSADMAAQVGFDELTSKVAEFQEWLTGIPGIDEATALSSVIGLIESGTYDTIVFDTAPTGHTLELRASPEAEGLTIVELPLLASEVTGAPALLDFSQRMVADGYRGKAPSALVDWKPTPMDFSAPPEAMELDAAPAEAAPKAPQTIPEMMAEMAQDPVIAKLLENPRIAAAYEEVKANPMACMNYMADPEFKPIVDKVMAKMFGG